MQTKDLNTQLLTTMAQTKTQEPTKSIPTAIIFGDSNIHRTKSSFNKDKIKWTVVNNVYTTEELNQTLEDPDIIEQLQKT